MYGLMFVYVHMVTVYASLCVSVVYVYGLLSVYVYMSNVYADVYVFRLCTCMGKCLCMCIWLIYMHMCMYIGCVRVWVNACVCVYGQCICIFPCI